MSPADLQGLVNYVAIPTPILHDLLLPEVATRPRRAIKRTVVPVPETSVHVNGNFVLGEYEVWTTWNFTGMQAESVSRLVQQTAD